MKSIRILSLVMSVFMLLSVMSACGSDKKSDNTDTSASSVPSAGSQTEPSASEPEPASEVEISGEGEAIDLTGYTIIHPRYSTSYITKMEADKLITAVNDKYGAKLRYVADSVDVSDKEIILGLTSREGSKMLDDHEAYSIRIENNKIYVEGGTDRSISMALSELTALVNNGTALKNGFVKTGNYKENIKNYDTNYYKYVFGDDFDGTDIDTEKWSFTDMGASDIKQIMSPDTYALSDGKLSLFSSTIPESLRGAYGGAKYMTPRFLSTNGRMEFLYGCVEINAMIPFYYGNSAAFWFCSSTTTPTNYSCEIDMVELLGSENNVVSNLHTWTEMHTSFDGAIPRSKRSHTFESTPEVLRTEYHTYFMEWTPEYIDFGVDAEVYYHADLTNAEGQFANPNFDLDAFRLPVYFIVSEFLYTPGRNLGWGLKGDEKDFLYIMNIDHIDLYQTEGEGKLIYK